jgi:hypothetical protein
LAQSGEKMNIKSMLDVKVNGAQVVSPGVRKEEFNV